MERSSLLQTTGFVPSQKSNEKIIVSLRDFKLKSSMKSEFLEVKKPGVNRKTAMHTVQESRVFPDESKKQSYHIIRSAHTTPDRIPKQKNEVSPSKQVESTIQEILTINKKMAGLKRDNDITTNHVERVVSEQRSRLGLQTLPTVSLNFLSEARDEQAISNKVFKQLRAVQTKAVLDLANAKKALISCYRFFTEEVKKSHHKIQPQPHKATGSTDTPLLDQEVKKMTVLLGETESALIGLSTHATVYKTTAINSEEIAKMETARELQINQFKKQLWVSETDEGSLVHYNNHHQQVLASSDEQSGRRIIELQNECKARQLEKVNYKAQIEFLNRQIDSLQSDLAVLAEAVVFQQEGQNEFPNHDESKKDSEHDSLSIELSKKVLETQQQPDVLQASRLMKQAGELARKNLKRQFSWMIIEPEKREEEEKKDGHRLLLSENEQIAAIQARIKEEVEQSLVGTILMQALTIEEFIRIQENSSSRG